MTERVNVGEAIARLLEEHDVNSIYGVISIHNLPIADAVGRREKSALWRREVKRVQSLWPMHMRDLKVWVLL